jgi:hypothetical protein
MDLVGRKLPMAGGAVVEGFFDLIAADLDDGDIGGRTRAALALLRDVTTGLRGADIDASGAVAVDYLRLFALVAMGWMWTRMAAAATDDTPLHSAKRSVAAYFAQRILPQAKGLADSIASGKATTMALEADAF